MDFLLPIWQPFVDAMVAAILWVHDAIESMGLPGASGLSIIAFTVILRVVTVPLYVQQLRSTKKLQQIQPEIQALQRKYGKDREKLMQEQMRLYREYNINPAAGCLPMLIQMPIWIGLYSALNHLNGDPRFQESFLWLPSLAQHDPIYILPILTVVTQWVVQRMMMTPTADPQQQQMNQVMQFMPIMFGFFALQVPSGLVLYWVVSNLFTMIQQYFVTGWGMLLPNRAATAATATPPPRGAGGEERRAAGQTNGAGRASGAGAAADSGSGTEAEERITGVEASEIEASTDRNGIRSYTLKADRDGGAVAGEADGSAAAGRRRGRKRLR